MLGLLKLICDAFWSEYIWLPPNFKWKDISPGASKTVRFRSYHHLYYPIPMAFVMLLIRFCLEKYCLASIGMKFGLKVNKPNNPPRNAASQRAFSLDGRMSTSRIQEVGQWLKIRGEHGKQPILVKFCESAWRFCYYISAFPFGLVVLWDKPWLWDINHCWYDYPNQSITDDIWWYYMISLTYYWSLCISQFFDIRRKDFWQMFLHHIATISLMCFSWVTNFLRMGTLVLVLHDCVDIFLEASKLTKYTGHQELCNVVFVTFTILWIVTRLGIYPLWILRSTTIDAPRIIPIFPAYYIFNGLLIFLLTLHVFWTYLILKIAYNSINAGGMNGDIRSDSDYSSEDESKTK